MAKKKKDIFKLQDSDLLPIVKGLQKATGDGRIKLDDLMETLVNCPFCGMEGTKENPCFIVDRDTLTWRSKCCGRISRHDGGAINYVMLTRTKGPNALEDAVKYLKDFVR